MVKVVSIGQIRTKDTANVFGATPEYGFEVIQAVDNGTPGVYKHLIRMGGVENIIAGWNIDSEAIYVGTKKTSDGYAATGSFSIASNGSIHSEKFYINSNGDIGIRSSLTGQRIELDSTNNNIKFYISGQTDPAIRIDDNIFTSTNPGIEVYKLNGAIQTTARLVDYIMGVWKTTSTSSLYSVMQAATLTMECTVTGAGAYNSKMSISMLNPLLISFINLPTTALGGNGRVYLSGGYLRYG
jgi:hypothetical protein